MQSIFVFSALGRIIWCSLCNVGDMANEFNASLPLRNKLADPAWTVPGHVAVGDWAYAANSTRNTIATAEYLKGAIPVSRDRRERWMTFQKKVRSPAEYGMRHMQGMFPRMQNRMPTHLPVARMHMRVWSRLSNLLVSRVESHSELRTMFELAAVEFEADAALLAARGLA